MSYTSLTQFWNSLQTFYHANKNINSSTVCVAVRSSPYQNFRPYKTNLILRCKYSLAIKPIKARIMFTDRFIVPLYLLPKGYITSIVE